MTKDKCRFSYCIDRGPARTELDLYPSRPPFVERPVSVNRAGKRFVLCQRLKEVNPAAQDSIYQVGDELPVIAISHLERQVLAGLPD